jgi:hypothetical protein
MSRRVPAPLPGTPDTAAGSTPARRRTTRALVAAAVAGGLVLGAGGASWANHDFPDVPASNPFHSQISWMADAGITGGFGDGTFRPGQSVTRGQMAAFMQRLFDLRDTVRVQAGNFAPIDTPEGTWIDVDGVAGSGTMATTVNVPAGTTATILVRYGAETLCEDTDGAGYCFIQVLRGATPLTVGHNTSSSIDSVTSTAADDSSESHLIERWATNVGPGNHTIKVQATEGGGGVTSFSLDNQTLSVQVILDPS